MRPFKHLNAASLEEAVSIMQRYPGHAKMVAGGSDLIGELKDNILADYPEVLVNIKSIPGLDFIREESGAVLIGALTRLEDIASNQLVRWKLPMLAEAAAATASPHIREMGTLGGNINQSNRCWYYWVPDNRFHCLRKGGKNCFALTGEGRYHSIFGGVRVIETPCSLNCPDNIRIPDYMEQIRTGNTAGAAEILLQNNPLPAITGRVCPHFCESECNRRETDEAVSIRGVERYLGDYVLEHSSSIYASPQHELGKKVAIVGSGPSGLTAAYYLRTLGYSVTVLDNMPVSGGLLVYGIPPYRLPKEVVRRQVEALAGMGIRFETNTRIGAARLAKLMKDYAAVYVAGGAWQERTSGINGEEFLLSGSQFLRKANVGGAAKPGQKVAVIGGGNVAIDVARTLLRLGCQAVLIYRRSRAEMPAMADEVRKAEEEGLKMEYLTLPVEAERKGSKIHLKCQKMTLGPPDESGRPRPVAVPGSDYIVDYDAVLTAIGEEADLSLVPADLRAKNGGLKIDESSSQIKRNLFAGGDFVSGPSTVVAAIAAGRKAAGSIDRFLRGSEAREASPEEKRGSAVARQFNSAFLTEVKRSQTPELEPEARLKGFAIEEEGGLDSTSASQEANRCFNCSCVAVNSSDLAPALVALNAKIVTTRRKLEAENFFSAGVDKSSILAEDEIIKAVEIPSLPSGARSAFSKFALRKSIDFPVVNCAAVIESDRGLVKSARICLNSVFNQPLRMTASEQRLAGQRLDESLADEAAAAGLAGAFPLLNNQYKIKVARALVKRVILACLQ